MSPTPLSPSTVHIALQYIVPPSQLDQPLPPYLLSKPLLQRHHFLQIPPEDPAQYLCWPSDSSAAAVDLLEALPRSLNDAPQAYHVQYTSDTEHTHAHVALTSDSGDAVRLVFQWEEHDGWKFHDTKLMPFPQGSMASLSAVLDPAEPSLGVPHVAAAVPEYNPYGFGDLDESSDDDDYWNAYGAGDSDDPSPHDLLTASKDIASDGEDAYWARYASVQGTADSTIPSPPIQRRRPDPYADQPAEFESPHALPVPVRDDFHNPHEEILPIPPSIVNQSYPTGSRRSDPASPKDLARRLAELSPRQAPALISDFEHVRAPELDASDTSDAGTTSSDALGLITSTEESPSVERIEIRGEDEEALGQSIKGLYALWRLNRSRKGMESAEQDDRAAFMRAVEDALA